MPIRPCLSCAPSVGFDDCAVNQFGWWNAHLSGTEIQTATHSEIPSMFTRDIPAIDTDCWGAEELQLVSHYLVADKNFVNLCGDALSGQNVFYQLHRCGMRRAIRHIQDFDSHRPFLVRSDDKSGHRLEFFRNSRLQAFNADCSPRFSRSRSVSLVRTSESFRCNRRRTAAHGCNRSCRNFKSSRTSLSVNPKPCACWIKPRVSTSVSAY